MKTGQPTHQITSILGGQSPTAYFYSEGQFLSSVGIDPDISTVSAINRAGGVISPTKYATFSGATKVDDSPMWIITNPKNTLLYAYLANGAYVSYTSILGSETDIGTIASSIGNGAAYYNNYLYFMSETQVFRYGPLDGTPQISNALIANGELLDGWDATADTLLTDTTYPSFTEEFPNHAPHAHSDGALYLCDFKNGQGLIHKIKTKRTTVDGDTNDGSSYNVLDLPFGYLPFDIESYGTDLAIAASQTTDDTLNQGPAALFFWDTISDSFYQQVPINDPLATALYNRNGKLIAFSGNRNSGFRIQQYIGGYSFQTLDFFEEGYSPFQGAVDGYGERMAWGSSTTEPETAPVVYSLGYKNPKLPQNARHSIVRPQSSGTIPRVTSLKYAQQASGIYPRLIIGWSDQSKAGALDSITSGVINGKFRSQLFTVGFRFKIVRLRIRLSKAVGANTSIVVALYFDGADTSKTLATINSTNYTGSERIINYKAPEIEGATTAGYIGNNDFFIDFDFGGSDENSILLPVDIWVEQVDD